MDHRGTLEDSHPRRLDRVARVVASARRVERLGEHEPNVRLSLLDAAERLEDPVGLVGERIGALGLGLLETNAREDREGKRLQWRRQRGSTARYSSPMRSSSNTRSER